jgi:hypothetical protein
MKDSQAWNGLPTDIGALTDDQIYDIHLAALGFPKGKFGDEVGTYQSSHLKRLLTVVDSFIHLMMAVYVSNPGIGPWCLPCLILCIVNIPVGPLSLGALLVNVYLDHVPAPKPSFESLNVGSPESLSLVAEFLSKPTIRETERFIAVCEGRLASVERVLADTMALEARLLRERDSQARPELLPLYDQQVSDARAAIRVIHERRDEISRLGRVAAEERAAMQRMLNDMRVLAHASFQLRVVKDRIMDRTQTQDVEQVRRHIANICVEMKSARETICGLRDLAIARARAISEVNQMSRAS